jgi:hypothetical protein
VQSSNEGIIVCEMEQPAVAGSNRVVAYIGGKGFAASLGPVPLAVATSNPLTVSGVSPSGTSTIGNGLITVTGEIRNVLAIFRLLNLSGPPILTFRPFGDSMAAAARPKHWGVSRQATGREFDPTSLKFSSLLI